MDSIKQFFNSNEFMPHGHCFLWQKNILLLHIISDAGIALAYFGIPMLLFYLVRKRKDLPYKPLFSAFSAFILLCGTTHLLSIWVLWHPDYAIEGVVKALTAVVSIATLLILWKVVPLILHMITPADAKENAAQFEQLANSLPQLAWMADETGWIYWYNDRWFEYTGTEKKDMEGWGWQSVHDPEMLPSVMEKWTGAINNKKPFDMTFPLKGADGNFRSFLTRVNPVFDRNGNLVKWFGTNTDINEQKGAENEALESLRTVQEGLELGWQGVGHGMWDWNVVTDKLIFSDRMLKLMGYMPGEIGNHIEEWETRLHPDDKPGTFKVLNAHLENGQSKYDVEYRLRHKSGEWRWYHAQGQAKWDKQGKATRMVGSLSDINERRVSLLALERSESFNRSLMQASGDCIKILDLDGRLLQLNDPGICIMEIDDFGPLCGKEWWSLWPEETQAEVKHSVQIALSGQQYRFQALCPTAKNTPKWWDVLVSPVFGENGQILHLLSVSRDITQSKEAEKLKSEFVSTVSHELRTPLTSIRGSLGLILAGVGGIIPAKGKNLIEIAHKNCERLILIINDILDVEKIASGQMQLQLEPVSTKLLIEEAVELNKAYGEQYNVTLATQSGLGDQKINVDRGRFMQVMSNLISNAMKFSPPGSTVQILAQQLDYEIQISVVDKGEGIPKEFHSRIFSKFSQADSSNTKAKGGTGLGLNITKSIVERMGGTITFTSEINKGTTFTISFPVENTLPKLNKRHGKLNNKILVCEDDVDIGEILKLTLEKQGFVVDVAHTAKAAGKQLRKNEYTAMTLDLILPDKDGLDFFREIRTDQRTHNLPIIVISAKAEEGRKAINGGAVGIVDWLVKPIDDARLITAITRIKEGNLRPTILHVEDDSDIAQIMALRLQEVADVIQVSSMASAKTSLQKEKIDLLLLDIELPDGSGLELLEMLNADGKKPIPIVIFSASEVPSDVTKKVNRALIKAKTSEKELVATIISLIRSEQR